MTDTPRDIAAVLLTYDRSPGRNYLEETLGNIEPWTGNTRLIDLILVENGENCTFAYNTVEIDVACNSAKGTPNEAVARCLEYAAEYSSASWVLFLEDDINVIGSFFDSVGAWLDDYATPDCPIYPLGANNAAVSKLARRGERVWEYPVSDFYGTQGVAIRAEVVPSLVAYIRDNVYKYGERGAGYDHLMRDWALEQGVTHFLTPCPSFVQHIGRTSSIDPRAVVHIFPSFPGSAWSYLAARKGYRGERVERGALNGVSQVAVLTPFRNARANLPNYFQQLTALSMELAAEHAVSLRLVAAEGDSTDGTRERIQELAADYDIPLQLIPTDHGGGPWGSVEDPERLKAMSGVMNAALEAVTGDDDVVVWVMSDLDWDVQTVLKLIQHTSHTDIVAPMTYVDGFFYDTWAYRGLDGKRFSQGPPYHPFLVGSNSLVEISSAGSCLVMRGAQAREHRATHLEAVSFCNNASNPESVMGSSIAIDPSLSVHHRHQLDRSILILGHGPTHPTGLSQPVRRLLPALAEAGISPHLIAINYDGEPHPFPYKIWPAAVGGRLPMGEQRLLNVLSSYRFDAVLIQAEPWNIPSYVKVLEALPDDYPRPILLAWVGVDGVNNDGTPLNTFDHVITWTEFGKEDLTRGGCTTPISVATLGVDPDTYHPIPQDQARAAVLPSLPADAFVVGTVARNQRRKRIDLIIETFAKWVSGGGENTNRAHLYLHLTSVREGMGYDVGALVKFWGLEGRVHTSNGQTLNEQQMAHLYNCFDVYINMSEAEGWGLPVMEAAACGVPVICPRWGGVAEWSKEKAWRIPVDTYSACMPLHAAKNSDILGMTPKVGSAILALSEIKTEHESWQEVGEEIRAEYSWDSATSKLLAIIQEVMS